MSSPRTGSTTLAYAIQKQLGGSKIRLFNEPFENNITSNSEYVDLMDNYVEYINPYIVKTHTGDFYKKYSLPVIRNIYQNRYFLIRIRRKNVCQQMASCYIEFHRKIWGYYVGQYNKPPDIIPVDKKMIDKTINFILMFNYLSDVAPWNFDLDLWYEDLDLPNDVLMQTPKPINYDEIENLFSKYQ